jgi:hypothetical protein
VSSSLYLNFVGAQIEELEVGECAEGGQGDGAEEVVGEVQLNQVHQA